MEDSFLSKVNSGYNLNAFDYSFLEDEVRDGFYVPAVMKQFWAAELETLQMLDRVCRKHGIRYFADWGTLLGAIRHGGFVPWDDDLDVLMFRKDYMKLINLWEEHPEEFDDGCELRTFRNREDFKEFHAIFVNTTNISFAPEHLERFHGFPYIAGIDIFVLDHKSKDISMQKQMAKNALYVIAVADEIGEGRIDIKSINANLDIIRNFDGIGSIPSTEGLSNRQLRIMLYEAVERLCSSFEEEQSDKLIQNVPWGLLRPEKEIDKDYYLFCVDVPFEYTTIPIPGAYDSMLRKRYGEYLRIKKGTGAHEYPCFAMQERQFKASLDFEIPSFSYIPEIIDEIKNKRIDSRDNCWKETAKECLENMRDLLVNSQEDLQCLVDLQQLTVDLGEFLEKTGRISAEEINLLEKMCEEIYELYSNRDSSEALDNLWETFKKANKKIETVLNRKEIVFIPFKQEGWNCLCNIYEEETKQSENDIVILEAPLFHKRFDGKIIGKRDCDIAYPQDANVCSYADYDFDFFHPDRVYIQMPYDEWNPVMTFPTELYAEKLAGQTDKLIYVPWFEINDFSSHDRIDIANTKYYIPMPGVVYADEIILSSQKKKELYIDELIKFAGDGTEKIWDEKIVIKTYANLKAEQSKTKTLFYYIGLSFFIQFGERAVSKLNENYHVFMESMGNINIRLYIDPAVGNNLPDLDKRGWEQFCCIIDKWQKDGVAIMNKCELSERIADACDAYYGDPGPYVRFFAEKNKPVMIQSVL